MLGTSLLALARSGSKRSDSATKERAQGAPPAKKKDSRGPMKRGEGLERTRPNDWPMWCYLRGLQ